MELRGDSITMGLQGPTRFCDYKKDKKRLEKNGILSILMDYKRITNEYYKGFCKDY